VLGYLLDLARAHAPSREPVMVHAPKNEHQELRQLAGVAGHDRVAFVDRAPHSDAALLRTDCLYDSARLRRALRAGRGLESAIVWRLDRPELLAAAGDELARRLSYQPLGKYWAFPLAKWIAERLCATAVRPNVLTLSSGALLLVAAGVLALSADQWLWRLTVSLSLAAALILDTADGRLARLQGTSSSFGRWLDQVCDELADMALHIAIAWAAFCRDAHPVWLVSGMMYAAGKYLFLVQSLLGRELEGEKSSPAAIRGGDRPRGRDRLISLARLMGHADLRWHLWIVLSAIGRLDVALVAYAGYFPLRAIAAAIRKGVRYA
jgi:phosphatidylglycerophosphate synthase